MLSNINKSRLVAAMWSWAMLVAVVYVCVNYAQWLGWLLIGMQIQAVLSMWALKGREYVYDYFKSVGNIYTGRPFE